MLRLGFADDDRRVRPRNRQLDVILNEDMKPLSFGPITCRDPWKDSPDINDRMILVALHRSRVVNYARATP